MGYDLYVEDIDRAYYAGLIDGEAHLGIRKKLRPDGAPAYGTRVSLRMSEEDVIRKFAEDFDIRATRITALGPLGRVPMFEATTSGRKAKTLLEEVLPHLRIKRRQAELIIQLETEKRLPGIRTRRIPTSRTMPDGTVVTSVATATGQEYLDRWQAMREEVSRLNRPGREDPDGPNRTD